ncbi:MAG: outer membrane lipoprotein-sorting protein [Gammaproteobacteria bacterium]|nr:outer membrane lipoprotein-sorting protein [Gammaproteobacteria bacterium]
MKLRATIRVVTLALLVTHAINVLASDIDPKIEQCIRKNAPKATAVEKIKLTSEGSMYEEKQVLSVKVYWKHSSSGTSNMLALFDEPYDISGTRLLFLEKEIENEIYLYMPALFKVRRITSDRISSSMYGMDFSYEDFQFMYNMMATAITEQRPDAVVNGKPMYVFAIAPTEGKKSLYETIYSYFDKESCIVQKVEFYEQGNKLRKVLVTEPASIKIVNGIQVPHKFQMSDIKKASKTELTIISVSMDIPINDSLFDPVQLKEHRDIF